MSTKTVRRITGSLRLIGVTAAVAAGIAGFATVTPSDVVVEAAKGGVPSQQACDHASDRALERSAALASCAVIVDPVFGDPILDPIFDSPVRGRG
jgi:hypothetical protein